MEVNCTLTSTQQFFYFQCQRFRIIFASIWCRLRLYIIISFSYLFWVVIVMRVKLKRFPCNYAIVYFGEMKFYYFSDR